MIAMTKQAAMTAITKQAATAITKTATMSNGLLIQKVEEGFTAWNDTEYLSLSKTSVTNRAKSDLFANSDNDSFEEFSEAEEESSVSETGHNK